MKTSRKQDESAYGIPPGTYLLHEFQAYVQVKNARIFVADKETGWPILHATRMGEGWDIQYLTEQDLIRNPRSRMARLTPKK